MTLPSPPTALIAEDEPLLAQALRAELARAWPTLKIVATAGDGISAVQLALQHQPEVLFFDIRMPGQSGLEAAAALADAWPQPAAGTGAGAGGKPFPALVFVTAYDQYAVQAFEVQAVDYLLKPLQPARLQKTAQKLQSILENKASNAINFNDSTDPTWAQLRALLAATDAPAPRSAAPLTVIAASSGNDIHMVAVEQVLAFEAADKYVRVLTAERELLIRTPLKELIAQLDPQQFWQIHRSLVVRATAITTVSRDDMGKLHLQLRGRPERWAVSRLYAHLFKAM